MDVPNLFVNELLLALGAAAGFCVGAGVDVAVGEGVSAAVLALSAPQAVKGNRRRIRERTVKIAFFIFLTYNIFFNYIGIKKSTQFIIR